MGSTHTSPGEQQRWPRPLCLWVVPRFQLSEGLAAVVPEPATHGAGLFTSGICSAAPQNRTGPLGLDSRATAMTRGVQLSCGAVQPLRSFGGPLLSQPRWGAGVRAFHMARG